jgi:hypothetical protein
LFTCKVCLERSLLLKEKDARIHDLLVQIEVLTRLTVPPKSSGSLPTVQVEQDYIFSGSHEPVASLEDYTDDTALEANQILTGTY